jgi:Xaa-Pro aminopeptidase
MGGDVLAAFKAALPKAEWIDVENPMCDLQAQKSPAEIEVIRYAYKIAELGLNTAVDVIQEGITEREVAAEAEGRCVGQAPRGQGSIQ